MDPDPTPDPTPFFSDFEDSKKIFFFPYFFYYNLPAGTLSSFLKIKLFAKNFVLNFISQVLFHSAQHLLRKGKDPDPDPHPYI
jgi:hypothetical protein